MPCGPDARASGFEMAGHRRERREGRVALEGLGERHATLRAEFVPAEAAHTAKEGGKGECSERCMPSGLPARTPILGTWFEGRPIAART